MLSEKLESTPKAPRVHLPHIIDYNPSVFSSLDPLRYPIAYIEVKTITFRKESLN